MKFGRNLPRNQVPEWASSYIDYKALKKIVKQAASDAQPGQAPDLAGFFFSLDRNLEDVDQFYNKKFQEFARRQKLLEDRYTGPDHSPALLEQDEREELLEALLELRGQLRKLQWYGEVNRRGFIKITKKLDKKIPTAKAQKKYLELKVDPSPFAANAQLLELVNKVNNGLSLLNESATTPSREGPATDSLSAPSPAPPVVRPATLSLSREAVASLDAFIRNDSFAELVAAFDRIKAATPQLGEPAFQQFLKTLLQRAISARSKQCITALLDRIVFLDDPNDINRRNCIHRLVIAIGRTHSTADSDQGAEIPVDIDAELYQYITPAVPAKLPVRKSISQEKQKSKILERDDEPIVLLQLLLDNLHQSQRSGLLARDGAGRTPLHFAAHYGVRVMCQIIMEHLQTWRLFNVGAGIDGPGWLDNEGFAPVHLSIMGGHPLTTQALLDAEHWKAGNDEVAPKPRSEKTSAMLALATKSNFIDVVRILVNAGVNINFRDEQGETALHVAARFGHADCARLLLAGSDTQKADVEIAEKTYSWTPLFIACVDGHLPVVELLIDAGADLDRPDSSGWTAKEHASLRGHMDIATRLAEVTPEPDPDSDPPTAVSTSPPTSSLLDRNSAKVGSPTPATKVSDPVKSFGHRYLTDKSMILVSLGSMDMRKTVPPVSLDRIPLANAHSTQLDTALSIVVSAKGAEGEPETVDLPVQDHISTEPMVFHSEDPTKVKLLFDLVPTYAGSTERILGRGVALLSTIRPSLGSKRISLQGDSTVPIIAANTLEVIGSVTFNFLVITPFQHPNMSVNEKQTYWKSMASTMVIGHRGLGKNMPGRNSLQLGENTIQSFIAAANLGASYVEFDVQLTKDLVPVIYHDFLVSETGIDAPVHTLTLEQFLHVSDVRTPRHSRQASPAPSDNSKTTDTRAALDTRLRRSKSVSGANDNDSAEQEERMKHTRDWKKKGFKGNTRGNYIQAPFATLEEMFKKIPRSVGFNIEMKYPMLSESEDEEMDTYAHELNSFVDTVLTKVYDLGKGRNIIFSSFNPDICLLLSFKQPSIPVMFLTDAGTAPVGDIRASSLQEAIRFASRWNLLGVVSAAQPFVISPRLVRVVKESGLVCVSYGALNNDPEKVKLQVKQGIDAVIVDSVLKIRKGLTETQQTKQRPSTASQVPTPVLAATIPALSSSPPKLNVANGELSSTSTLAATSVPTVTTKTEASATVFPDRTKSAH